MVDPAAGSVVLFQRMVKTSCSRSLDAVAVPGDPSPPRRALALCPRSPPGPCTRTDQMGVPGATPDDPRSCCPWLQRRRRNHRLRMIAHRLEGRASIAARSPCDVEVRVTTHRFRRRTRRRHFSDLFLPPLDGRLSGWPEHRPSSLQPAPPASSCLTSATAEAELFAGTTGQRASATITTAGSAERLIELGL